VGELVQEQKPSETAATLSGTLIWAAVMLMTPAHNPSAASIIAIEIVALLKPMIAITPLANAAAVPAADAASGAAATVAASASGRARSHATEALRPEAVAVMMMPLRPAWLAAVCGTGDALAGRFFADAQCLGHLGEALLLVETQHEGAAIGFAQTFDHLIRCGANCSIVRIQRSARSCFAFGRLSFAETAVEFAP